MKKFIKIQLTAILAFALCFASCSKKDSKAPVPDTKILLTGDTWSIIKTAFDDNKNGQIEDAEFKPFPADAYDYITFSADGTAFGNKKGSKCRCNNNHQFYLGIIRPAND